jgi:hypothetical protein
MLVDYIDTNCQSFYCQACSATTIDWCILVGLIVHPLCHECHYHILGMVLTSTGKCLHLYSVQNVCLISLNFSFKTRRTCLIDIADFSTSYGKKNLGAIVCSLDTSLITQAGLIS